MNHLEHMLLNVRERLRVFKGSDRGYCRLVVLMALSSFSGLAGYEHLVHAAEPEFATLEQDMLEAYQNDLDRLADVTFRRQVTRRSLDRNGNVKSEQVLVMRVSPSPNGFYELLVEIDGRAPTKREITKHQDAAVFSKHYRQLKAGRVDLSIVAELTLSLLLKTYDYTFEGEEELHGIRCYRFSVEPFDPPAGASATETIAAASEGEFWIAAEGSNLVRMRTHIVRPLKTMGVGLNNLSLNFDAVHWGDAWLASRMEVRSVYKMLGTFRKHNIWTYSDFEEAGARVVTR